MNEPEAILTVECKSMKDPKKQRPRFDQTLAEGSWVLIENSKAEKTADLAVNTISKWSRPLGNKKQKAFIRSVGNLLNRASKYSGIDEYNATLQIDTEESILFSNNQESDAKEYDNTGKRSREKRQLRAKSPGQAIEK